LSTLPALPCLHFIPWTSVYLDDPLCQLDLHVVQGLLVQPLAAAPRADLNLCGVKDE
jgi:hypothetical protein